MAQIPAWADVPDLAVEPLGGLTNTNYLCRDERSSRLGGGSCLGEESALGRDGDLFSTIMDILRGKLGHRMDEYAFPPPVFVAMEGEFLDFDLEGGALKARFPVRQSYLNPFGTVQGGMVAAAVDNTFGPLSMLVAPPSVTRQLEMTYSRPVTPDVEYIVVSARLLEREDRWLYFRADVRTPEGLRLARSKAVHWIVE